MGDIGNPDDTFGELNQSDNSDRNDLALLFNRPKKQDDRVSVSISYKSLRTITHTGIPNVLIAEICMPSKRNARIGT